MKTVCVFCGSADGIHPDYYEGAVGMGRHLAEKGIQLVYGAGKTGLMGAVADGVLAAGGQVTGIVPSSLNSPRIPLAFKACRAAKIRCLAAS